MTARLAHRRAETVTPAWLGREVWVGVADVGVLMAVQQYPSVHRTILTLALSDPGDGSPDGLVTLDVRADTTVTTDTARDLLGGAL